MTDFVDEARAPLTEYVERIGLIWESQGLPRIAGRVVGYLTLQSEPVSLDDLASALGVSKASVSSDARYLARLGYINLTTRRGDRRDYYVIAPDMPARLTAAKLGEIERLHSALTTASESPGVPDAVRARLRAFGQFQLSVIESLRALVEGRTR